MTARTIPFWQQMLNEKIEGVQECTSFAQLRWHTSNAKGFLNGVYACEKISGDDHTYLFTKIQNLADQHKAALKQQGVKA